MTFAFVVDIVAYGDEGADSQIRLVGPFELREPDAERRKLDPEGDSWEQLAAVFALRHDTISKARITKDSALRVEFASGRAIISDGDAWEMSAPGGVLVVGAPGEPAIWDGEPGKTMTFRGPRETLNSRIRRYAWRLANPVVGRFRQKV